MSFKVLQKIFKPKGTALIFKTFMCKLASETVKLSPVDLPLKTGLRPERDASVVNTYAGFLCVV